MVARDIRNFKKMSRKRILVAMIALCVATAPIFGAEGMGEATAQPASQVNGDALDVQWRQVRDSISGKNYLQANVPGYGEYLISPSWATRLMGEFVEAKADSTGRILVTVELNKYDQKLERQFICRDSFWLEASKGQSVAWTEVSFDAGKEYRTVERYRLLTKADAKHYFSFNEEYTRPKFEAEPTAQTTFGAPNFSKQQTNAASADQNFRIRGGKSKAERQLAKAQKAPSKGHSRVTNRRYIGG